MDASDRTRVRSVFVFMLAICFLLVLAGINRKLHWDFLHVQYLDILRVKDLIVSYLLSPLALYFMWRIFVLYDGLSSKFNTALILLGIYAIGINFGMHEPFNIFGIAYSNQMNARMAKTVLFFDEELGHWVFFAGFMLICFAGCSAEIKNPYKNSLKHLLFVPALLGIIVAAVVFLNMAWENTGKDLLIMALTVAAVAVVHLRNSSVSLVRLPIVSGFYIAIGGGTLATLLYRVALR